MHCQEGSQKGIGRQFDERAQKLSVGHEVSREQTGEVTAKSLAGYYYTTFNERFESMIIFLQNMKEHEKWDAMLELDVKGLIVK